MSAVLALAGDPAFGAPGMAGVRLSRRRRTSGPRFAGGRPAFASPAFLADLRSGGVDRVARWRALEQRGSQLGERLVILFSGLFGEGFQSVAIASSDSPALPPSYLGQAFDLLDEQESPGRLVLGPTTDGGFYLIGAGAATWAARAPALCDALRTTPLGSAATLAHFTRAATAHGLAVRQLPLWADVDDVSDLPLMARLVASTAANATTGGPKGEPLRSLREIYLHVTNRCALPCPHCYNRDNPRQDGEMTTERVARRHRPVRRAGRHELRDLGGDPLLRPDLFEIVDFITGVHERKVRIFFNRLISRETAAEMARVGRGLYSRG